MSAQLVQVLSVQFALDKTKESDRDVEDITQLSYNLGTIQGSLHNVEMNFSGFNS